ncbi:MAG: potassium channel protein [Xanthomonadales bacterium]|nr:NAD-binding protein [Gammaproteobacteria bacterium]MBT8053163.1 NAD-binding protein [Gammaproteobacteria bacterium]NND56071.1 potassium channel protein [Xanthomonadales bacterium]NNK50202.1 potassium channel protein [Xanthomonadales bacterium]
MNDIVWLTMRRLRTPLILMILVYSLSVFILVHIPGQDEAGNPVQVGYLDAVYFVAITATTIGFGEMPYTFTHAQRLYAFIILFPNVIAWLYSIGTIISLFVDPQFRAVMARARFSRRVRRMSSNYYIVCGCGHTGRMILRGLLKRGISACILEREQSIIHSLALDDSLSHLPALSGDVTDRRLLDIAGLSEEVGHCIGVIAITNDDHANLTIAITSKLLRPDLPVLARAETRRVVANMASFGTDATVDPYTIFAQRFYLALTSPTKYLVQDWLISVPGTRLREEMNPPSGRWILAGIGRFGSRMAKTFDDAMVPYTVIDVHKERVDARPGSVLGRGTEAKTLQEAGISDAVGIIAGTGDDMDNLSIIMTAREMNTELFVVARQENPQNDELFDASGADLVARRSLIVARRIMAVATTPLLPVFNDHLIHEDVSFANSLKRRLSRILDGRSPSLWTMHLSGSWAASIRAAKKERIQLRLEHLIQNARSSTAEPLPCLCLLLERGSSRTFLPAPEEKLKEGDTLLFTGRGSARIEMLFALEEPTALLSIASGRPHPRGAVMRRLARKQAN